VAKIPPTGGARQPRPKNRTRQPSWWLRVRKRLPLIVRHLNAALAGHHAACISRDEALEIWRCWKCAVEGDPEPMRQFRQQHHGSIGKLILDEESSYYRRLRSPARSNMWKPLPAGVPPPLSEPPYPYVVQHAAAWDSVGYASPREQMFDAIHDLFAACARRGQLGRLRVLEQCDRCKQLFIQEDRRRDRGPRILCDRCRPLVQQTTRHEGERRRQRRKRRALRAALGRRFS
jgi:hypothetical protein